MEQGRKKHYIIDINRIYTKIKGKKNTLIPETWFMLKSVSQVMRLCVCLPFKDLNHDFQFSKLSVKKLLKGQTWGNTVGGSCSIIKFTFTSGNYVRVRRGGWTSATSPRLWESEASYTFNSTLGQTRSHSPVCKPPILKDIDNLEQETAVTQTPTSLSLIPCSLGWGLERLQNKEMVLPAQVCAKPHIPGDYRSGEGMLNFKNP